MLSKNAIKIGGWWTFWGAMVDKRKVCFYTILAHRRTRGFWTLTHYHDLIIGPGWLKIVVFSYLMYQESKSSKKSTILRYVRAARVKTRENARTRVNLKNAQNHLKRTLLWSKSNFEYFYFLTRPYARVVTRALLKIPSDIRYWPEVYVYEILLTNHI